MRMKLSVHTLTIARSGTSQITIIYLGKRTMTHTPSLRQARRLLVLRVLRFLFKMLTANPATPKSRSIKTLNLYLRCLATVRGKGEHVSKGNLADPKRL